MLGVCVIADTLQNIYPIPNTFISKIVTESDIQQKNKHPPPQKKKKKTVPHTVMGHSYSHVNHNN